MFTNLKTILASVVLATILFTGCKKAKEELDFAIESANHSDDETIVSNEVDALANDMNAAAESNFGISGRESSTLALPCDASIAIDTVSSPRKVTITYNGSTCNPLRTRTGTVVYTLPAGVRWRDAGATMSVTITNLKITRTSDNKSITLNGTKSIKNITGGLLRNLATVGTITHEISSSSMTLTFDDNTQRVWQISKKRLFTYNNGIVISTTGNATVDGVAGVAEWGTNRYGNAFSTVITQAMTVRQDCNFRLTAGELKHTRLAATITVTFGLDANGNVASCPISGTYYFKAVFTRSNGNSHSVIKPYF